MANLLSTCAYTKRRKKTLADTLSHVSLKETTKDVVQELETHGLQKCSSNKVLRKRNFKKKQQRIAVW